MSFNFNPLSNSIAPMRLITPNTGNNFLPKLSAPLMTQQSTVQMHKNNDQIAFEFNITSPGAGQGPMELENPNEQTSNNRLGANNNCDHSDGCENGSSAGSNSNNFMQNSNLMFNEMMNQIQPQFMMLPSVMMDPTHLLSMNQFPILNLPTSTVTVTSPTEASTSNAPKTDSSVVKEIIHCPSCTLIPPNPNQPPPTTRERPPGCKTIFVGGLPENITEAIIHEIFERCGEITTLRLSKKNFCHIRFIYEASVDSAIYLSGYRIKIGSNSDAANTGRLHVDYAHARDDQYEFECRQRQLQREQRHRERVEKDRMRSTSPPLVVHYTDHEAASVSEKIKSDETFLKAVQILITWLERGDCMKKNANIFYSMIQSTNSHIRRLLNEKSQFENELAEAKAIYKKQMLKMAEQFNQIEKVFNAASHKNKKVWDHFTKAQRKNIDQWCKQMTEVRTYQFDDVQDNDEMEMSDDDNYSPSEKRTRLDSDRSKQRRKDELAKIQLDIKTESDLKESRSDADLKNKQIKVLQETIRNLQRKLIETSTKEKSNEGKIAELEENLRDSNVKELLLRTKIANARTTSQSVNNDNDDASETSSMACFDKYQPNNDESHLISLSTAFLVIHPTGAHFETLLDYINQFVIDKIHDNELFDILLKHEKLFYMISSSDSNIKQSKWLYSGFKCSHNSSDNAVI